MTTVQLAFLVAFMLLGPLDTSAADCTYRIKTITGTSAYAGTDALVRIKLHGLYSSCGWRILNNPGNDFEKGSTNYFTIMCPCLGPIKEFTIKHNNQNSSPSLYLTSVSVKRPWADAYQTFTCNAWIWSWSKTFVLSSTPYRITIYSASWFWGPGPASANMKICRTDGICTVTPQLNGPFDKNSVRKYYLWPKGIHSVRSVYTEGSSSWWRVDKIYVYNRAMKINYRCPVNGLVDIANKINCNQEVVLVLAH